MYISEERRCDTTHPHLNILMRFVLALMVGLGAMLNNNAAFEICLPLESGQPEL